jgi:hypothetical protein
MNTRTACYARLCTFVAVLFFTAATTANAQGSYNNDFVGLSKWDIAFNAGPSNFLGDVGGNKGKGTKFLKDLNMPVTNIFYGLHLTYFPREWIGIRASFNTGKLSGFDSLIKDQGGAEKDRKNRNLGFRTDVKEIYVGAEIYPTIGLENNSDGFEGIIRPYFVVGIGVMTYNPQGQYIDANGRKTWVDLKPLHLEGQGFSEYADRKEYSNYSIQVPVGIGLKYFWNERLYFGAEILQRFTFTDYIDDVSKTYVDPNLFAKYLPKEQIAMAQQLMFRRALINNRPVTDFVNRARGNAKDNDYYLSILLKVGFRFATRDTDNPYRKPVYSRYY